VPGTPLIASLEKMELHASFASKADWLSGTAATCLQAEGEPLTGKCVVVEGRCKLREQAMVKTDNEGVSAEHEA